MSVPEYQRANIIEMGFWLLHNNISDDIAREGDVRIGTANMILYENSY